MIIDFHTHTFPDKIAESAIKKLAEKADVPYYRIGTGASLTQSMDEAGIDFSVVLPVVTAARQAESITRFAIENNGKNGLIYFGGIHPDCENVPAILDTLVDAGIKGVKLHPDYQECSFDDVRMIKIMYEAAGRGLITVTHAGRDYGFPDSTMCTPDTVVNVMKQLDGVIDGKLVLAHMGGLDFPDEVLEKLCGLPLYFDTSYVLDCYPDKCREIMEKHGFDRILFATDSPWAPQKKFVETLRCLNLSKEQEDAVFYGNAAKLLKM